MCDTFVALPSATATGTMLFGKNSDREPNEAQVLEYHPPRDYPANSSVRCTYLEIPQVRHTRGVLLSRPFWMWGAEIGANTRGVVIGNEAVWSKMPLVKAGRLTGMDLLRLALERGDTARNALEVMIGLLSDFGQGGPCGYESRNMVYHNSYIIADPTEAWVLETAGELWAARRVETVYTISNGLTIGSQYDRAHPELIATARRRGWLKKGADFHFADCYTDWFYTTFSAARTRCRRSRELLAAPVGPLDLPAAFAILRDHGGDAYRPDSHFLLRHLCAHSANLLARHAAQSTAALVADLQPQLPAFWATGTSAPCTSIFKPIWLRDRVLPGDPAATGGTYTADSRWWRHERLHRAILQDFKVRQAVVQAAGRALERRFLEQAAVVRDGSDTSSITARAFASVEALEAELLPRVAAQPVKEPPGWVYRRYWSRQNRRAGLPD